MKSTDKKIKKNGKVACFDVDETLIYWFNQDEYTEEIEEVNFGVNCAEFERLKRFHTVGYTVVVWSQSGADWAKKVCEYLEIDEWVDTCMTKPDFMIDDKDPEEWCKILRPLSD